MPWFSDYIDAYGWVEAVRLDEEALFMEKWLAQGLHRNLDYLARNRSKRYDIRELVPGAQSVLVALLTYSHAGHDYHRGLKSQLYQIEHRLATELNFTPLPTQHIFCDSAPVLERAWAVRAGLGFIGKNHQLIHPVLGSYVHIGELVLPINAPSKIEVVMDGGSLCASCRRCVDACPGQALGNALWDPSLCIAYQKPYSAHRCTICSDVCPFNAKK